ncbi:eukaryotic translation initiation factor 3 subunit G-domain-containing protein [Mycena rebaudengoi]|nr:eukaryotic translation initiation factor 3 subunit G-domain-containing protein [Mycena rebaudengoi]KAJ7236033.1 eukaryotic translation initiation factor 3 subunit G-domain-containing protein [Mycena rebaudengoi]
MPVAVPKTSWADEVDEAEDFVDENGIRTTIEYTVNDDGKKVKITRRSRRTLQKSVVDHTVAERLKWSKFGQEKGKDRGPDRATTTVGENVTLKISAGNKHGAEPEKVEEDTKTKLAKAGAGKVICRLCKGEHFTAKCPHKDALAGLEMDAGAGDDDGPALGGDSAGPSLGMGMGGGSGGKYVPPSMRGPGGTRTAGPAGGGGGRDDLPTLRVTNISEDTQENDLRELFGIFGRVARVYVGRDRETGAGKGFAFVSFEERAVAQKAMEKVNGKGYDNLILSVQWSQPRPEGR